MTFRTFLAAAGPLFIVACHAREAQVVADEPQPKAAQSATIAPQTTATSATPAAPFDAGSGDAGASDASALDAGARAVDTLRALVAKGEDSVDASRGLVVIVSGPQHEPEGPTKQVRTGVTLCGGAARKQAATTLRALKERLEHMAPESFICDARSCTRYAAGEWDSQETFWFTGNKLDAIVTVLDVPLRTGVEADFKWASDTHAKLEKSRKACAR
jgi:hypothetical protein